MSVKEVDKKVIFLRKLVPGGSEHSFGIHVAKMAGMPQSIIKRSEQILKQLEADNRQTGVAKPVAALAQGREGYQLSIFQLDDPVLAQVRDEIMKADIDHLTPVEALNKLNEIKKKSSRGNDIPTHGTGQALVSRYHGTRVRTARDPM